MSRINSSFRLAAVPFVHNRFYQILFLLAVFTLILLLSATRSIALFQPPTAYWYQVRAIAAADLNLSHPVGLAYAPAENLFLALERDGTMLSTFTPYEDPVDSNQLATSIRPANAAFYEPTAELIALAQQGQAIAQVEVGAGGDRPLSMQDVRQFNSSALRLVNPQGMTVDSAGGRLFILEGNGPNILRIQADGQSAFDAEAARGKGDCSVLALTRLEAWRYGVLALIRPMVICMCWQRPSRRFMS